MATAKAWYYPNGPDRSVVEIDLGTALQDLSPRVVTVGSVPQAGNGQPWPILHRFGLRVTLRKERYTSSILRLALEAMVNHLQRGGTVAVALDASKAWSGVVTGSGRSAGDTELGTAGNSLADEAPSAVLAAGDLVVVESMTPEFRREIGTVLSVSGSAITLSSGLIYDRDPDVGMIVRHIHCYPVLFLPEDQLDRQILVTEYDRLHTMEVELELHPSAFDEETSYKIGSLTRPPEVNVSGSTLQAHLDNPSALGNINP